MKHTNTKEFKAKIAAYLAPIIEDRAADYDQKTGGKPFNWALNMAKIEVPHEFQRKGEQGGLEYWLSGLGLSVEYLYSDIIALAEKWHECALTEKEKETKPSGAQVAPALQKTASTGRKVETPKGSAAKVKGEKTR